MVAISSERIKALLTFYTCIIGLSAFFPEFIDVYPEPIDSQTNKSPKDFYVSL